MAVSEILGVLLPISKKGEKKMKSLLKGLVLVISMVIAAPVNADVVDNTDTATPDFFSAVGTWLPSAVLN